ncbi:MAG: hypothetical protein KUG78_16085 [Kangiellaceae bacterium]|nr:hypothetical protein [Kangiellaceae bacterium]
MYRLLVRTAIFAVIIGLSLYIGAQWKLKQDLDLINKQLGPRVDFDYATSALTIMGNVVVGGVDIYLKDADINVAINKVTFSTGSVFSMAFLGSQVNDKSLPESFNLSLDNVVIRLTPSLVKMIATSERKNSWNELSAVACGNINKIGFNQYFAMGYDYLVLSSDLEFKRDGYNGNLVGAGKLDIEETSIIDYQFDIAGIYELQSDEDPLANAPSVELISVKVEDVGYNRHRNEYCALKAQTSIDAYLLEHMKQVKSKFVAADVKITPTGSRFYKAYLQPGSITEISIEPKPSFSLTDLGFYDEKELRDITGLKLQMNGQITGPLFKDWTHDKFTAIDFIDGRGEDAVNQNQRFETIIVHREFEIESLSDIGGFMKQQARISRSDGKTFTGKLNRINKGKVYIDIPREGGVLQVSIELEQINRLEILKRK